MSMDNSIFIDRNGNVTPYGLACGYIQTKAVNGVQVTLWRDGGCTCTHVRVHDFNEHKRVSWETFLKLADARRFFRQQPE